MMQKSIISTDVTVTGNLVSDGAVQVDGQVNGDVTCTELNVSQTGKVTGGLAASNVVVQGQVNGTIKGEKISLEANSKVDGDLLYKTLSIADGASFDGGLKRSEQPLA